MGLFGFGEKREVPSVRRYLSGLFWRPPAGYDSRSPGRNGVPDYREIKRMLKAGSDVDERAGADVTALHMAVDLEEAELVTLLLERKPRVNVLDCENRNELHQYGSKLDKGYAPLHVAIAKGNYRIVESLLDGGADPNFKTSRNESPLDLAEKGQDPRIVGLLVARGAVAPDRTANRVGPEEIEATIRVLLRENRTEVRAGDRPIPAFSSAAILRKLSDMGFSFVTSDHRKLVVRSERYWAECECDVDADSVTPWVESFFTSLSLGAPDHGEPFARIAASAMKQGAVNA